MGYLGLFGGYFSSSLATGGALGGIRGLMKRNLEQRIRFIQNGWLA